MKIKTLIATLSLATLLTLTSCGSTPAPSTSLNPSVTEKPTEPSVEPSGKTNKDFEKAKTTYTDKHGVERTLNMQTIYQNTDSPHLDPLENQNILVVPFGFTDAGLQDVQSEENVERIKTIFFGEKEEIEQNNGWLSVTDYYNKASYGKAQFKGDILPTWLNYNKSSSEFIKDARGNAGIYAAEHARTRYVEEYGKPGHGLLGEDAKPITHYDANNDGFIDCVWVVYSHPIVQSTDWWAYVTYTGNKSNMATPNVKTLGWASIGFADHAFNGYDPHTFIHESGHLFGLDDYYDYKNTWKPLGGIDMMDQNIGDHNAFSKFTLGWLNPLVVDDTSTITLRPYATTGDAFLLPSPGYNGTAFDEYMLVELVAPVGLSEDEYKNGYQGTTGYNVPGLRITHIDGRVWGANHDEYLIDNPQDGRDFRTSNTHGGRQSPKFDSDFWTTESGQKRYYPLISLMESTINEDKNWTTSATYNASSDSLFQENARFSLESRYGWAKTFMPSQSNLWNKAKTITGWEGNDQTFTIDETITFDYKLKVDQIRADDEHGYVATIKVTKID